jgi:hypothetical protein
MADRIKDIPYFANKYKEYISNKGKKVKYILFLKKKII